MNVLVSTLRDTEGRFLLLIEEVGSWLQKSCGGGFVAFTEDTDSRTVLRLKELGLNLFSSGQFGEARIASLRKAYESGSEGFLACDFDKVLHWLRVEPKEFLQLMRGKTRRDYIAYGRSERVWKSYPTSWLYPESAINGLVSKMVGFGVDILTSVSVMNRAAAKVIVENAIEKNWGSVVEWFLLPYKAGLFVEQRQAKGLTWEDPDRFGIEIVKAGGLEKWKVLNYDSVDEWEKRFSSAMEQIEVIRRLTF